MFLNITCKLGNMKKPQRFVICPVSNTQPNEVTIQSDKRIARIDTTTGKATLSDGKGGHQGFAKLHSIMGATQVDVPADVLETLKPLVAKLKEAQNPDGSITICV